MLSSDPEDVRNDVFYASSDSNDKNTYGTNKVWLNKMPAVNGDPRYSNVPMMRLSEIYLTAAECAFNLGEKAVAADFLNAIIENRTSDASKVVATDNITKDRIYIERRKELVGEGHRYFDCLRRNEKIVRYTTVDNRGWHSILTRMLRLSIVITIRQSLLFLSLRLMQTLTSSRMKVMVSNRCKGII